MCIYISLISYFTIYRLQAPQGSLHSGDLSFHEMISVTRRGGKGGRFCPEVLNSGSEQSPVSMTNEKDPIARQRASTTWVKENCLAILRAWLFVLGEKREMSQREGLRIASVVLQFPTPRRLNRYMEILETQGVIEFFDDWQNSDKYLIGERDRMRILSVPFEIAQETNR